MADLRCSAVSRKTACKCFTDSILELIEDFFVKLLIEKSVNISNQLIFLMFIEVKSALGG